MCITRSKMRLSGCSAIFRGPRAQRGKSGGRQIEGVGRRGSKVDAQKHVVRTAQDAVFYKHQFNIHYYGSFFKMH